MGIVTEEKLPGKVPTSKRCPKCGKDKWTASYEIKIYKVKKKSGYEKRQYLSPYCRDCKNARNRDDFHNKKKSRKKSINQSRKNRIETNRKNMLEYLSDKSCVDCGESDPVVLEFDHEPGVHKRDCVSRLVDKASWKSILEEIGKTQIVCVNCHRIRTFKRHGWYKGCEDLLEEWL